MSGGSGDVVLAVDGAGCQAAELNADHAVAQLPYSASVGRYCEVVTISQGVGFGPNPTVISPRDGQGTGVQMAHAVQMEDAALARFRQLHAQGLTVAAMAAECGVGATTIYRWLKADSLPTPSSRRHELESRLARSVVAEAGCLVWTGGTTTEGYPAIGVRNQRRSVRQLVFQAHGKPVTPGSVLIAVCGTLRCIEVEHLTPVPASQLPTMTAAAGNSPAGQKHWKAILDWSAVDTIRASSLSTAELVEKFGVSRATINSVRAYRRWTNEAARRNQTKPP